MERILEQKEYDFLHTDVPLPDNLTKIIDSGFRTEQGCILYKDFEYFGPGELDSDLKKTEYELFLNDINIADYTKIDDEVEALYFGLEIGKRLYKGLKSFSESKFRIIISFIEPDIVEGGIESYAECIVNFHVIRPSCNKKSKLQDYEQSKTDGVMIIE